MDMDYHNAKMCLPLACVQINKKILLTKEYFNTDITEENDEIKHLATPKRKTMVIIGHCVSHHGLGKQVCLMFLHMKYLTFSDSEAE